MGVKVKGGADLRKKIALYKERAQGAAEAALYQRALMIMNAAKSITPVDTGRLRASAYVSLPEGKRIKMGFGADYALPVHERLDYHHEHGYAKFLEHAIDEYSAGNKAWIKEKMLQNIRNGVELRRGDMPTTAQEGDVTGAHHQANKMNKDRGK